MIQKIPAWRVAAISSRELSFCRAPRMELSSSIQFVVKSESKHFGTTVHKVDYHFFTIKTIDHTKTNHLIWNNLKFPSPNVARARKKVCVRALLVGNQGSSIR